MFNSFIQGGFECSTQRLGSGRRLDLVESTGHQRYLTSDYLNLSQLGIATVREGARWNSIRRTNGSFDWSSLLPFVTAARRGNIEIIWDLVHFGWPDELDIFSDKWIEEFSEYAFAFASLLGRRSGSFANPGQRGFFPVVGRGRGGIPKSIQGGTLPRNDLHRSD
jgi:hypothetical protein